MKAVFLDRDGTINREVDVLRRLKQLRILPGVSRAIAALNRLGFLVVVVTNQPVIARGWITKNELDEIHAILIRRLKKGGAKIDAVYYCPHHPQANLERYRMRCRCRKPNIGMVMKAVKKFKIDVKKSFMVGDSTRDILTGKRAGLKTILVMTGYAGKDGKYAVKADFVAKNLLGAVKIIKKYAK
jgi:histidinol-phosphate phosphatase family protein